MPKKLYEESNIQEIASTIREKNGTQDTYKVSQMAGAMSDLIGPPAYNNMILAQDTEPDSEYNKVWFDTDANDEYTFPQIDDNNVSSTDTWSSQKIKAEDDELKSAFRYLYSSLGAVYDGEYMFNAGYIENALAVGTVCDYTNVKEADGFQCTVVFGVKPGDKFMIVTHDSNSARAYAWLNRLGEVVYVPERNTVRTLTEITAPANAEILVINIRTNTSLTPHFYRVQSLDAMQDAMQDEIDAIDLSACVQKSGVGEVTIENCDFTTTEKSVNACNPVDIFWDKGLNSSGSIVDAPGYILTGDIHVENAYAFFAVNGSAHVAYRLGLYKKDGTFERVSSVQAFNVTNCDSIRACLPYTALTDWFYVGFSASESVFPEVDQYRVKTIISPQYLPESDTTNPYFERSAVAFGTSLTARAYEDHKYDSATYGYLTYLRAFSGMTIDNQGIGGATLLSDNINKSIYLAITNYSDYANKDICIIEGFVNDWAKNATNTLGTYTDTGTATVCGRLRSAITHILTQNPQITIFVILDHYGQNSGDQLFSSNIVKNGYTQYTFYAELQKVCESMGIKCIKEYAISEISELTPQYLADYIHCNDLGAKQSAKTIWDNMRVASPNE